MNPWFLLIALILLAAFMSNKGVATETVLNVKNSFSSYASDAGLRFGVDKNLILAVICVESSGKPDSTGGDGERGLMQLMLPTFQDTNYAHNLGFTWDDMFSPYANIVAGTSVLADCLASFPGDTHKALQAYNGGIAGVKKNAQLSYAYAEKVLSVLSQLKTT
jgi:soluble lytic murein transglycosylase-like protein